MTTVQVRLVNGDDCGSVADIYNHYVASSVATFEESPVTTVEMERRIREVTSIPLPWLIAEDQDAIAGYAYAGRWKGRAGYRFTVESSVYVHPSFTGRRIGWSLYGELLTMLRQASVHCVIGGITLPNPASIALHERFGFEQVAHFRETGFKFDRWLDVGYWQLLL